MNIVQQSFITILKKIFLRRLSRITAFISDPASSQDILFSHLISLGAKTEWGKAHGFSEIKTVEDFQNKVPVSSYEDLAPYIERMMNGEKNILYPGRVKFFSKSSGTTNARSKYIPVPKESLKGTHLRGGRDAIAFYVKNVPDTKIFLGKTIGVIGSLEKHPHGIQSGDVSAVVTSQMPFWVNWFRSPRLSVSLMKKWEDKIGPIVEITSKKNITMLAGVPTWEAILLEKILTHTDKTSVYDVWPHFELIMHGGVAFDPYRSLFKKIFNDRVPNFMEIYNASEGFFAVQDDLSRDDLLLMLDHGIFYEFIPLLEYGTENPTVHTINTVETDVNYAMIISTTGGLWRYSIGDTVRFTSLKPHRIKITGRTKHFINAFGEEMVIENAEAGLKKACEETGASIRTWSVAPLYMSENGGAHEWFIEFETSPASLDAFMKIVDDTIRESNSDYDAKRAGDVILRFPILHAMPEGSFYEWMKRRGKLGAQNKVPALVNNREFADQFLALIEELK